MIHNPVEAIGSPKEKKTHTILTFSPQHCKPHKQLSHETEHYVSKTQGIKQSPQIPTCAP